MDKSYFVMIYDQHGGAIPMVDSSQDEHFPPVKFFATADEADEAAKQNMLAQACGWDIHQMGGDCA